MDLKSILKTAQDKMDKSVDYLSKELRGVRTGRASTGLVEYVRVDYYGSQSELRDLAAISVPEPTMLMIKPFDPSSKNEIVKAIETADLGLNPQTEGNAIRVNVPAPSAERRKQLVNQVRKMAEDARVAIRNERRDAMKHIDQLEKAKDNSVSEDEAKRARAEIEELTKKHTERIDEMTDHKAKEVETVQ